jgi:polysaccharide export outer membrane protein
MLLFRILLVLVLVGTGATIGGCAWMPTAGPAGYDVDAAAAQPNPESVRYALVKVTPQVERVLALNAPRLGKMFRDTRPPKGITFGVNDILSITIFESQSGGLFIPSDASRMNGNFVTIPNQPIDTDGNIVVPYAGKIRAAGRTPVQVEDEIIDKLKDKAIKPQVIVSIVNQNSSLLTVLGDVGTPSRFPANYNAEHLLDTIARAGGPRGNPYDTWVMLERNHKREIVPFGALLYEPDANNIWTHPNDTLYLYIDPQTFVAFGATGSQGQFKFEGWRLSLAEAVAKSGGLNEGTAEPGYVFLYRGITRSVAEQFGLDTSKYQGPIIPVVFNVNFRDPAGYFLASRFQMQNKDVLYVSTATTVQASKAMNYFNLIVNTVNNPVSAAQNIYSLKNLFHGGGNVVTTIQPTVSQPIVTTPP